MAAPLPDLSNEQKLTYIYHTLQAQESRRKRAAFYKFLKWLIIGGLAYLVVTYPTQIVGTAMDLVRPIIMEQVNSIVAENQKTLMKNLQDALPEGLELALPSTPSTSTKSTPAATKPKTSTGTVKTTVIKK